jgi:transcription termination factor Rho
MLLPELKQLAGGLGIKGVGGMRKSQLIDAIKAAQSGSQSGSQGGNQQGAAQEQRSNGRTPQSQDQAAAPAAPRQEEARSNGRAAQPAESGQDRQQGESRGDRESREDRRENNRDSNRESRDDGNRGESREAGDRDNRDNRGDTNRGGDGRDNRNHDDDRGGSGSSRRNRRRRGRDRDRSGSTSNYRDRRRDRDDGEPQINEDDVLVPTAGILDVLDNYAFVRTTGYLPGPDDVYVSLSMVRKYALRRGDAITGQVRQPREGERKEKFNPLVRLDTVNGADLEAARHRVEFSKLTPLYPSERLRLETESTNLIGRVIDIAAPIGKGQRGLIVSPAKAGKTMIMQSIANSITTNNPECHLMVVLVDERPEEVTDFQRSVKGEVISSTFDRPASDHTAVAELAIERAKRLVELGHDVVVLLDGITRLGRAYNLAAPASGRILSGGVDSAALYPPKRFFGAARNIEDGGSLTILATALIESGSKMDEVIFEEFKGTGNMEIRLRRDFADKRIFPAIDAVQSGTRREELLINKEELSIIWKLRRVLSGLDGQQALELLLERLKKTHSNIEFLMQVQKTTPTAGNGRDND